MEINKKLKLYQKAVNKVENIEQKIDKDNMDVYEDINELIDCTIDIIPDKHIITLIHIRKELKNNDSDVENKFKYFKKDFLNELKTSLNEQKDNICQLINVIEIDYHWVHELQEYRLFNRELRQMVDKIEEFMEYLETIPRIR